jgi:flagellar assembly protein FliH
MAAWLFLGVAEVAMSLSKVYRRDEAGELKEFQFRSFGETEPLSPLGEESFIPAGLAGASAAPAAGGTPANLSINQQLEEAYARGRQDGQAQVEQRLESTTQALTQALEDVCRLRESLAQTGSQDMLRLVMAVAEQIIRRTAEVDPEVVLSIIKNALQASVQADSYRIRINPADLEGVTRQKPLFLASISGLKNLNFEADADISPGGCRVDSELGDVDATIESQLESIRQALSEAITEV